MSVIGSVKAFGSDLHLQAFDVRVITDYNEVTHHFLEAIYTKLFLTRGPLDAPAPAPGTRGGCVRSGWCRECLEGAFVLVCVVSSVWSVGVWSANRVVRLL